MKPKYILKYRDGRSFNYLAFYGKDKHGELYDQMESDEVRYWRRKGVKVRNGE